MIYRKNTFKNMLFKIVILKIALSIFVNYGKL